MRPDLFAGSAMRDDSHRLLARLAKGGSVPARPRDWAWNAPHKARIVAVAALLAAGISAWAWLRDDGGATPPQAAPRQPSAGMGNAGAAPPQPATIVYAASPQGPQAASIPVAATVGEAASPAAAAPAPTVSKPGRQRPAKPAAEQRGRPSVPAQENDEDVTLLTAMLKHATPQKPAPEPPKQ